MNSHRCAVFPAGLFCLLVGVAMAWGQGASIPPDAATADDPSSFEPQIQAFVQQQAQNLATADNPPLQGQAREALVKAVDNPDATPAYLDLYARNLNAVLLELAKHENLRVRLNAAIVAARVAEKANNTRLAEVAGVLIRDNATPVVMWGMTTAKWVLPAIMRDPLQRENNALVGELVPALKENPAGPVVQDTYEALTLGVIRDPRAVPQGLSAVIPQFFELLAYRVDLYLVDVPEDPWADQKAGLFLQSRAVWMQTLTPEQRVQAMQLLSNLLSVTAQQALKAPSAANRTELVRVVRQLGGSLGVIAGYLNHQGLRSAAGLVANVNERDPSDIAQRVQRIYPQLIQMDEFSGLQTPPIVGAAPATTEAVE